MLLLTMTKIALATVGACWVVFAMNARGEDIPLSPWVFVVAGNGSGNGGSSGLDYVWFNVSGPGSGQSGETVTGTSSNQVAFIAANTRYLLSAKMFVYGPGVGT